jgi:hypothetical protein
VKVNYLRKYRNRFVTKIELVSALDDSSFLISPPDGFIDDTPVSYNGVYFTLSSADLSQKSKPTSSGTVYTPTLEFSFPNFPGAEDFQMKFAKLSEIRITLNTGADIRLNKNDIALNAPIDVEFQGNLKTIYFSASISQIYPLKFDEQ